MTEPVAPTAPDEQRGRNRIAPRAIRAVAAAVTGEQLETPAKSVGVELGDHGGQLTVTATAPVRMPSLAALLGSASVSRSGATAHQTTIVVRATNAQKAIREHVQTLTGCTIGVVDLRLTSARIEGDERVQ